MSDSTPPVVQPYVIVCEGPDDCAVIQALIAVRGLPDLFRVKKTGDGGNTAFSTQLQGMLAGTDGRSIKGFLLIADNDSPTSFDAIADQVREAGWPKPASPKSFVEATGKPPIAVLMIPEGNSGCLESVLMPAFEAAFGLVEPINNLLAVAPAKDWEDSKKAKGKVHVYLASTHKKNPATKLHEYWKSSQCGVDLALSCPELDAIEHYIRSFDSAVKSL